MQLLVQFDLDNPLTLPISYNHLLQSIVYRTLAAQPEFSALVHNRGFAFGRRRYRLFTFSLLEGRYKVKDKKITFFDCAFFEVRSPEPYLIRILRDGFRQNGITFGERSIDSVRVDVSDVSVESMDIFIEMRTPIVIYSTGRENRKTLFYTPAEEEYALLLNDNFVRKYLAFSDTMPASGVLVEPWQVTDRDKFVTNYKGQYITGWKGVYRISGERKYLDFLYQSGIGGKNAQGFGMFDVISEE